MSTQVYTFSNYLEKLKDAYSGKPLPVELSDYLTTQIYPALIPHGFKAAGEPERPIYTHMGLKIATGYQAIVFTDYGPFLEITKEQLVRHSMQQSSGISSFAESNVSSYIMYRSNDGMANIRYQTREIMGHAFSINNNYLRHFRRERYYLSVYEAADGTLMEPEKGVLLPELPNTLICQPANCFGVYQDGISHEVSAKWPFIKTEYAALCSSLDPLALLGSYQVVQTGEENSLQGIANLFCDMTNPLGKRRAGMNYDALVNCIYNLCCDNPDCTVIIPHYIGCTTNTEWNALHLKLSCRLKGKNVKIVKQKRITHTKNTEKEPTEEQCVMMPEGENKNDNATNAKCEGQTVKPNCKANPIDTASSATLTLTLNDKDKAFALMQIFDSLKDMDTTKLTALAKFLQR